MNEERRLLDAIERLQQAAVKAAKPKSRTVEDFVNDLVNRGRTLKHILTVALATRWKNCLEQIKEIYDEQCDVTL